MPANHFYLTKPIFGLRRITQDFDVTKRSCDGAEVCELVGLYLLKLLTNEFGKHNIILRIEMMVSHVSTTFQIRNQRKFKKMCKIFKENLLNITVECNLAIINFLDVTFDLKPDTYYLYRK